jgi:hypothetical protein
MREKRITVRLTEEEYEMLSKLAEERNLSVSELVRKLVFERRLPKPTPKKAMLKIPECRKLAYELNKIGVNLNQIARRVNINKNIDLLALELLAEIEEELLALSKKVFRGPDADKPASRTFAVGKEG